MPTCSVFIPPSTGRLLPGPVAAFGQLLGARKAMNLYNARNQGTPESAQDGTKPKVDGAWTLKHGYFLVMGGFHIVEPFEAQEKVDARPDQTFVLSLEMLEELCKCQDFEIPVRVEEIADKSKSDGLSKAVFVFQTTWFIAQCITRHCQGLGLTALELTTAGLRVPMRVYLKDRLSDEVKSARREELDPLFPSGCRDCVLKVKNAFLFRKGISKSIWTWLLSPLLIFPFLITLAVCNVIDIIMPSFPQSATCVPIYYVPKTLQPPHRHFGIQISLLGTMTMAVGGIHCAGWNMEFPTHIEQLLWRYSSLLVTVPPVAQLRNVPPSALLPIKWSEFYRIAPFVESLVLRMMH